MAELFTKVPRATLWLLPEDDFTMGGPYKDAQPRFEAEARAIYIGKTVITNEQYEAFDPAHQRTALTSGDDDPVVNMSFFDAKAYCDWYAELAKKDFRLPTELEWEYACRGGNDSRYYWGDSPEDAARYICDSEEFNGQLPELEALRANNAGLYDMLGTVWEWTSSLYLPYPIVPGDGRDDPGTPGERAARGGSFKTHRSTMGSGVRLGLDPNQSYDDVGFRIVRFL
jgi:formylglycine-generating enzyme required for sulfatase activity